MSTWSARVVEGVGALPASAWDALVGDDQVFERHAFLAHLEASGSVGPDRGWRSTPVVVEDERGRIVGAAPAGVKSHSHGEYIFDWAWADAAQRNGIAYYPKVVVAVPYTPATGPRLLVDEGAEHAEAVRGALVAGAQAWTDEVGGSGLHFLFTRPQEEAAYAGGGLQVRMTHQYHWHDRGFGDFQGYLDALTSKRRKEVRRERRQAQAAGFDLAVERVVDLTDEDRHRLYRCYLSTIQGHWAYPYLTEDWWMGLGDALPEHAWVATARDRGSLVAGSLCFLAGRHLYGRYWGALVDAPALHFELCYYQLIAFGLERGVRRIEAGAQGRHKIARGFLPAPTWSAHRLRHPGLWAAVERYIEQERGHTQDEIDALSGASPFREPPGA